MIVHVCLYPPLPYVFGLSKGTSAMVLEVPIEEPMSPRGVFGQLASKYPAFEKFSNPEPGTVLDVIISVDGKFISWPEKHESLLHDGSEIFLFPPYRGG